MLIEQMLSSAESDGLRVVGELVTRERENRRQRRQHCDHNTNQAAPAV